MLSATKENFFWMKKPKQIGHGLSFRKPVDHWLVCISKRASHHSAIESPSKPSNQTQFCLISLKSLTTVISHRHPLDPFPQIPSITINLKQTLSISTSPCIIPNKETSKYENKKPQKQPTNHNTLITMF